jgi:hypothetical protein
MVTRNRIVVLVLLALVLIDCGSGGKPPSIVSFVAGPTSLPALGAGVTLSWDVSGADALAIDNGIGNLPANQGSEGINLDTSTTFTLTASNSAGTTTALAIVTITQPTGDDISGKVTDANSNPAPGLNVLVSDSLGVKTTVTTDSDGNFSVLKVAKPYSVTIVHEKTAYIFPNLIRATPKLPLFPDGFVPTNRAADLRVATSDGGVLAPGITLDTVIAFASSETSQTVPYLDLNGGRAELALTWVGSRATITNGVTYVLEVALDDAGLPASYDGYGSTVTQLRDQQTGNASVALSPVTAGHLIGTVTVPSDYVLEITTLYLNTALFNLELFTQSLGSYAFSYIIPEIPETTLTMSVLAAGPTGQCTTGLSGLLPNPDSGVAIDCRAGPVPISPLNGEMNVTTATVFSWSEFEEGIYLVEFRPYNADVSGPVFVIWTEGASASLPDLSAIGLGMPANVLYNWQVTGFAPLPSIDALTAPITPPFTYESFGNASTFYTAESP